MSQAPILGFFGPFRFLSNFHIVDVEFEGHVYKSTEHAYQAAKTLSPSERELVREAPLPRDAKKLGMLIEIRPDWLDVRVDIMHDVCKKKFVQEPLKQMLLDTGDAHLEETNTWNDQFWGVCNGVGKNMLGQILMLIRDELKLTDR